MRPQDGIVARIGVLGLTQGNANLVTTSSLDLLAGLFPFLPGFGRWKAVLLVEVFTIGHAGRNVVPRQGDPTALDLPRITRQIVPSTQLCAELFHEIERFERLMVQMGLAEEQKDNIMPGARLLLFGDLNVGITMRDEIDLDVALVGLLKFLCPALQILVR